MDRVLGHHGGADRGVTVSRIGDLRRITRPLHPGLRRYLRGRTGYSHHAPPYRVRMVPTGRVTVSVNLAEPFSQVTLIVIPSDHVTHNTDGHIATAITDQLVIDTQEGSDVSRGTRSVVLRWAAPGLPARRVPAGRGGACRTTHNWFAQPGC